MTDPVDPRLKSLDDMDLDGLEDFESEDFEEDSVSGDDGRNSAVSAMWDRWGFRDSRNEDRADRSKAISESLVIAHQMVQTFVDTFSTDATRYRVAFDPSMSVAGTDFIGKAITISPSPVYDETLTPQQAGVILTGMAGHEVSHVRYGRSTAAAVRRTFGAKRAPDFLSNVLDDVRIERRFAEDYPGYRDVFEPLRRYVGERPDLKGKPVSMTNLVNLMVRAVRLSEWTEWPTQELRDERDWWRAWSERWSKEDSPRRHVEGVREGLKHIVTQQQVLQLKKKQDRDKERAERRAKMPPDLARLRDGLADLPPLAQKAMRLVGEGKSGLEVAATLGMSVDDARVLVRSARRQLAGDLNSRRVTRITVRTAEDLDRALGLSDLGRAD